MTKRDVMSIALRIMGIVSLYWVLISIPGSLVAIATIKQWAPEQGPAGINSFAYTVVLILHQVLMLFISYILLFQADRFSERLIKTDVTPSAQGVTMSEKSILTLAIRIVGVYELAKGIPDLSNIAGQAIQRSTILRDRFSRMFGMEHSLEAIVTVVLGFGLLLGASYIADWVCSIGRREEVVSSRD